jgi:hypothetical protein
VRPYLPPKPSITPSPVAPTPQPAPAPASDLERFRTSRRPGHLLSSTIDADHEDAGVETAGADLSSPPPYNGVIANHTVYQTGKLELKLPENATRTQTLFGPTTRPPNGACLEVGTAYTTDITTRKTSAAIYVFDFCKAGGPDWGIAPSATGGAPPPYQVNEDFMNKYAGALALSVPAYALTIFTPDSKVSTTSTWYAQLFNYATQKWDTLYQSRGSYDDDPRGWSIFETWFQAGQCSQSLPVLGADQLAYYNSSTRAWEPLAEHMLRLDSIVSRGGNNNQNCFQADPTGAASYLIGPVPPVWTSWEVSSTGH